MQSQSFMNTDPMPRQRALAHRFQESRLAERSREHRRAADFRATASNTEKLPDLRFPGTGKRLPKLVTRLPGTGKRLPKLVTRPPKLVTRPPKLVTRPRETVTQHSTPVEYPTNSR
jgi:hypothetical protein